MNQRLTSLAATTKKTAQQAAPFIVAGFVFATASPETQTMLLHFYAVGSALLTGWAIVARFNHRRWLAAAPQRKAASLARVREVAAREVARQEALRAGQSDADWFNWDGPYTVGGQPR